MIKHIIIIILLITLTSCKKEKDNISNKKFTNKEIKKEQKINCFEKDDSLRVVQILNRFKQNCDKNENVQDLLTQDFIENFKKFPCKLFNTALNNNAIPDFEVENQSNECNTLAIYYNYIINITDDDQEYSSESTLILYLVKDTNGIIFLEAIGAAG